MEFSPRRTDTKKVLFSKFFSPRHKFFHIPEQPSPHDHYVSLHLQQPPNETQRDKRDLFYFYFLLYQHSISNWGGKMSKATSSSYLSLVRECRVPYTHSREWMYRIRKTAQWIAFVVAFLSNHVNFFLLM